MSTYHESYLTKPGDTLWGVSRRFGHGNPGPILYYPANQHLLRRAPLLILREGIELIIPYTEHELREYLSILELMIKALSKAVERVTRELNRGILNMRHLQYCLDVAQSIIHTLMSLSQPSGELLPDGLHSPTGRMAFLKEKVIDLHTMGPQKDKHKQGSNYARRGVWNRFRSTSARANEIWLELVSVINPPTYVNPLSQSSSLLETIRKHLHEASNLMLQELTTEQSAVKTQLFAPFYQCRV